MRYPVGMESGHVIDSQLFASSVYVHSSNYKNYPAYAGRPHKTGYLGKMYWYWKPAQNDIGVSCHH